MARLRTSGLFKSPHTVPYLAFAGIGVTLLIPWAVLELGALEFYGIMALACAVGVWLDTREEPPDEPHNGAERS